MTYVDDCNALIPLQDVKTFLELFEKYGGPLGAQLNTEKTRILTSTKGPRYSILPRLLFHPSTYKIGVNIWQALSKYSRELNKDTGTYKMCEKTDGLRILGVPIGCKSFCDDFIMQAIKKAISNCDKIIDGLDSDQTVLQIFRACTAHKMTHLFAADVLNNKLNDLPRNWYLWESEMADEFSNMIDKVISSVTRRPSIPAHAHLIAIMSTKNGGLGIPHPRSQAIPTFIINTKRCIQYATDGIWIDQTSPKILLPPYITDLYTNWETSNAHLFQTFRKYVKPISNICVSELVDDDPVQYFIHKSSLNTCRERIKLKAASKIKRLLKYILRDDEASLDQLEDILEYKMSYSLLDLPRRISQRSNQDFSLMLKRKLRLELWPGVQQPICFCGTIMDQYGDHCLTCRRHCKTPMHNSIRDGLWKLFQEYFVLLNMTTSQSGVEKETPNVFEGLLPSLRPFDISILFDKMLSESTWRTPITKLGFDVTVVSSLPKFSTRTDAARKNEVKLRLRKGEKGKFQRKRKTDKSTQVTMSGDQMMQYLLDNGMVLLPLAITAHGHLGSMFERFLYGTDAFMPEFDDNHPKAHEMAREANSKHVPRGILHHANKIWKQSNPDSFYSGSYKAMDPLTHFDQQLGLIISTSVSSHLLRAHNKNKTLPPLECPGHCEACNCEDDIDELEDSSVPDYLTHHHTYHPPLGTPQVAEPIQAIL